MQHGLVSVLVTVYNKEKFLDACVGSIQNQTYKNLEIILVDDGSTDSSGEMCNNFAKNDDRIKVIHKPNGGVVTAINAGLDVITGDYTIFVGGDDTIDDDMVERLYIWLIKNNVDMVICGYKMIYDNYMRLVRTPHEKKMSPSQVWEEHIKSFREYFTLTTLHCNKFIKTDIMRNSDGSMMHVQLDLHNSEDAWYCSDCIEKAINGIAYIDFTPYNYMLAANPNSISKSASYEDMNKYMEHLREIMYRALPNKKIDIDRTINCQKLVSMQVVTHIYIINKNEPPFKMKWSTIKIILRDSTSSEEKISAFLMFFLPKALYRASFKFYCKMKGI